MIKSVANDLLGDHVMLSWKAGMAAENFCGVAMLAETMLRLLRGWR